MIDSVLGNEIYASCDEHGEFLESVFKNNQWYSQHCPTCKSERHMRAICKAAGIPPLYEEVSFDNYVVYNKQQEGILGMLRAYSANFDGNARNSSNALITGTYGTGKGHLAYSILKEQALKGKTGIIVSYKQLLNEIWDRKFQAGDYIKNLCEPDLLIINEIGRSSKGAAAADDFFNLLDQRVENLKPFILISNYDETGLKSVWGEESHAAIMQRVNGVNRQPLKLNLSWESYRERA